MPERSPFRFRTSGLCRQFLSIALLVRGTELSVRRCRCAIEHSGLHKAPAARPLSNICHLSMHRPKGETMHERLLRTILFASTSMGLCVPTIASAQETAQQIGLEEIVVTARRVEENLMEVP